MLYSLASGVRLEPLDDTWASYSAISGETLLLNGEAASILELLEQAPMDAASVAAALASSAAMDLTEMNEKLRCVWDQLLSVGLVQLQPQASEYNHG